jgi:ATP-binding cassette subfamily F protein 3
MLHINDLTYRIQGRPLLERATLAVSQGERVGLVGRNGAGKTTLFRLIAGKLQADEGDISLQRGARVGWLTPCRHRGGQRPGARRTHPGRPRVR